MQTVKRLVPPPLRRPLSPLIRQGRLYKRWLSILLGGTPVRDQVRVYYGYDHIPNPGELVRGGLTKFQRMQNIFPNSPRRFNLLYLVSSSMPGDWAQLRWLARRRGANIAWNQNGVAYPGWHGPGWEKVNMPMARMLHEADYVFYQSEFCKLSADRFLGERNGAWEILYNAVDTSLFTPAQSDPDPHHLVLLLGGSQYQYYCLESALQTVAILSRERPDVRLLVTGKLRWKSDESEAMRIADQRVTELGITNRVDFLGPYTQEQAPDVFRRAHILLHTKYNDPCPGVVVEAMACGLPIVYSHSGGVPELVGDEAGIGVPAELSWEQDLPPDPLALAEAVLQVAERRAQYARAARQRAVEEFDLRPWLQRHREVFNDLLNRQALRSDCSKVYAE